MKKNKWFNKQYILLSVSILLGLIVLILGSSYAYYIVNITGNDDNNDVAVKTSNINLEISNVSGKLKLCKSYPINIGEALRCTPYQFTLTNNNDTDLEYYLNLEYQTSAPEDTIKVAFATCDDENCTNPNYAISKLSEILENNDTISSKYTGKLLTSGKTFGTGASNKKTYSIILWIDSDSTYEDDTFNASISAITYTQTQDILSYTLSFDLEDNATWTTDTCKSSDGYTINGTKCEKTIGVNESYGNLPSVTINGEDVLWYSDNKFYNSKATTDTKYTMRQNTIYKSTTNSALASHTFNYTGNEQLFVVPATGVYELKTWGAQGGGYNGLGGYGGYSQGFVYLTKNQIVYIYIGGAGTASASENTAGGYNGGGAGYNQSGFSRYFASGGGATHMTIKEGQLSTLQNNKSAILIVSGGGGGGYADTKNSINNRGGDAGGYLGNNGEQTTTGWGSFGYGGSQTKGGYSICDATTCKDITEGIGYVYTDGYFGKGGSSSYKFASSGGGSGYYGGGGSIHVQSAGGGSGYIGNPQLFYKTMYCYNCSTSNEEATKTVSTTCHNSVATKNCAKEGNGYAIINFYKG